VYLPPASGQIAPSEGFAPSDHISWQQRRPKMQIPLSLLAVTFILALSLVFFGAPKFFRGTQSNAATRSSDEVWTLNCANAVLFRQFNITNAI
jgi:hypothetical protein